MHNYGKVMANKRNYKIIKCSKIVRFFLFLLYIIYFFTNNSCDFQYIKENPRIMVLNINTCGNNVPTINSARVPIKIRIKMADGEKNGFL